MRVLSLFDGISCGRVALDRAKIKVDSYFASEVDKYAIEIAKKNYPNTVELGDVRNIHYDSTTHTLYGENVKIKTEIDMLIGGSPCQSFTFAGKRQGMSTTTQVEITTLAQYLEYKTKGYAFEGQSYLFWEYVRLLNEIKPKYFLLENVKMSTNWKDVISTAIGVEPVRINSNLVSAQNRDRLYWTNIANGKIEQPKDKDILLKDILDPNVNGVKYQLTQKHKQGFLKSYDWKPCDIFGKAKPLLASYYKQPPHCPYIPSSVSESGYRRLSPLECERLQTLPDNYTEGISDTQRYKTIGNGWTVDVIAHIFRQIED